MINSSISVWRPQITTCEEIDSSNTYFLAIIKIVIINSCVSYMINHLQHIMYKQLSIALNNRRLHWFYCLCSHTTTTNIYQANIYPANNSNSYHDRASSKLIVGHIYVVTPVKATRERNERLVILSTTNIIDCDSRYNRIDCELINRCYDQLTHQSLCMETSDHYV